MNNVIERLKEAAKHEASDGRQLGIEAGYKWAQQEASPKQLRALDREYEASGGAIQGQAGTIVAIIVDVAWKEYTAQEGAEFFEEYGIDINDEDEALQFVEGFMEGAVNLWREVADKV